ncbi:dihydroorotase [Coxiella endosymbiont of Amblyomma nuttalli]|uniref:dihydroorotase n=1 Tax=Coxiella endosymbiont of Amblyomma nuttalli TaxID=2749996 RepID=UPI001BA8401E|nr:dihydroorotase [Coxiella endosymbiont of Amblyomma nuttalli]QTS83737.1 Dihydroorotase [Coxiella endosymbiont of Amblyomma nuttalli]
MHEISLIKPDDWHCHLRDQSYLKRTVPDIAAQFSRAVIMPNLSPPITTIAQAQAYYYRIKAHLPHTATFQPLMTLCITETLSLKEIQAIKESPIIVACKLYPADVTTYSQIGIKNLQAVYHLFETMQATDLPLLIHGEVVDPNVDIFDREAVFIERELFPLVKKFPGLRIVFEHISTKMAVDFVTEMPKTLAATITPHHLLFTRNDLLIRGLHPHYYCLPILKTHKDQAALIRAATSGNSKFFLGTDSAPHARVKKEATCGSAGIYSAKSAIEIYTEIFEHENALHRLEDFASRFGAQFYRLPLNTVKITLIKQPWQIPSSLSFNEDTLVPLMAGETLQWQIKRYD